MCGKLFIAIACLAGVSQALDNAIRYKNEGGADDTSRPTTMFRRFAKDELCNYPKPFVNGTAPAVWQWDEFTRWPASTKCPSGSAQDGLMHFRSTVAAGAINATDFRDHSSPCSEAASVAACRALAQTVAQIGSWDIGAGAGQWNAGMTVTPNGGTPNTIAVQTMIGNSHCFIRYGGPVSTQIICGPFNSDGTWRTQRDYAFGWREKRVAFLNSSVGPSDTSFTVTDASHWAGLSVPFMVHMNEPDDTEHMLICYVDTAANPDRLYIGDTSCPGGTGASTAGRGKDGTSASLHQWGYNNYVQLVDTPWMLSAGTTTNDGTISLTDASTITSFPIVLKLGSEYIRICNKSGNTLFVGQAAAGCGSGSTDARAYGGTNKPSGGGSIYWGNRHPIYDASLSDMWVDSSLSDHKSLSPIFVITVYSGFSGIGVEFILENPWTDSTQDQRYNITFKSGVGLGTTIASKTDVMHNHFTSFHYPDGPALQSLAVDRKIWLGSAPGKLRWDFNRKYQRYAGLTGLNPDLVPDSNLMNTLINGTFATQDGSSPGWDLGDKGQWPTLTSTAGAYRNFRSYVHLNLPLQGGREDIGIHPGWNADCWALQGSNQANEQRCLNEIVPGTAYAMGSMSVFMREADSARKYCAAPGPTANPAKTCPAPLDQVSAFGYFVSVDARPYQDYYNPGQSNPGTPNDEIRLRAKAHVTRGGWALSQSDKMAHFPNASFAYEITGDWWFEQLLQAHGSYAALTSASETGYNPGQTSSFSRSSQRHGDWGLFGNSDGQRNYSWALRQIAIPAAFARAGTVEKYYFSKVWQSSIEATEGKYQVTDGSYYRPCPSPLSGQYDYSKWCFGYWFHGNGNADTAVTIPGHPTDDGGSNWMTGYFQSSLKMGIRLGLTEAIPSMRAMCRLWINLLQNPQVKNRYVAKSYSQLWHSAGSTSTLGSSIAAPDYATYFSLFATPDPRAATSWGNDGDKQGGYSVNARYFCADCYEFEWDGFTGQRAFEWIDSSLGYRHIDGTNFIWQNTPDAYHNIRNIRALSVSTTPTILFTRPPQTKSCSYAVNPASTLDASDTAAPQLTYQGSITPTLPSGQTSTVRITCGSARGEIQITVP